MSPALAGKTHRDHFVPCCCMLLSVVKRVNIWLYRPHALMDFNESWVIDATWEPSFVDEVKGHISRSKVIWGQVVRLAENVKMASSEKLEVRFEPNLVYWYNMWAFIWSCSQRSCTKVKGHLRSSCKIGWKCENGLTWNVEVRFEPNLVYWYKMETFIRSCGQRSQIEGQRSSEVNL